MKLVNNKEYEALGGKISCIQCQLNGGTAEIQLRLSGLSGFTTFYVFSEDDAVLAEMPRCTFRVVTTGGAELAML